MGRSLADQTHEMLMGAGGAMIIPNPLDESLMKRKKTVPFVESKLILVILDATCGSTPEIFVEKVLSKLKHKCTIKKVHFYPCGGWVDGEAFDFAMFSEQMREHLPKVQFLHVMHMQVKNFRLESTTIEALLLADPQIQDGVWELKLPNLVELVLEYHSPPVENFARALINCPRIETFMSHKYWHDYELPELYLPNCKDFAFRRGDFTSVLRLYLPRVRRLQLDGCHALHHIELLDKGHPDQAEQNLIQGSKQSSFNISMIGAVVSPQVKETLKGSGRVLNPSTLNEVMEFEDF